MTEYDFSDKGRKKFYKYLDAMIDKNDSTHSDSDLKYKCLMSLVNNGRGYERNRERYFQLIETTKRIKSDYLQFQKESKIDGKYLSKGLEEGAKKLEKIIENHEYLLKQLSEDYEKDLTRSIQEDNKIVFTKFNPN